MQETGTNIYTKLSKKYNLPLPIIKVICNHPFKFASNVIASNDDTKSIMFGYLFKIKLKKKYASKERQEPKSNI